MSVAKTFHNVQDDDSVCVCICVEMKKNLAHNKPYQHRANGRERESETDDNELHVRHCCCVFYIFGCENDTIRRRMRANEKEKKW